MANTSKTIKCPVCEQPILVSITTNPVDCPKCGKKIMVMWSELLRTTG